VLWADTATLVPWAATYDDPQLRGAALIARIYSSGSAPDVGAAPSATPQQAPGERSVPALDDEPPPTYHTGQGDPSYAPQPPQPPQPPVPRERRSRAPRLVAFAAGGLVLVLLLGVAISIGLTREPEASGSPSESPSAVPTESLEFSPGPSTAPPTPTPTATTPKPTLKPRKPVSVYGPVWKKGEKTYTMDFAQLGWAWRAPGDFDCLVVEQTKNKVRVTCTKLLKKKPDDNRRLLIIDRQCSGTSCSPAEQKLCGTDKDGYKPPLKKKDATTRYNTTTYKDKKTKDKTFAEFMLHYYKGKSGPRNKCVLVYVEGKVGAY